MLKKLTVLLLSTICISASQAAVTTKNASTSYVNSSGATVFTYGLTTPVIKCSPFQLCDLELQTGEIITSIALGDSVRWQVAQGNVGGFNNQTPHAIIKPSLPNLNTTLIILTNKRAYNIRLESIEDEANSMAKISFIYQDELNQKLAVQAAAKKQQEQLNILETTNLNINNLNFNYTIEGKASWTPSRVYTDGKKTIIELPENVRTAELPILSVINVSDKFYKKPTFEAINYRVNNNKFIVDTVIDTAMLSIGVGKSQEIVIIERIK